jgi:hypothetical protein
LLASNSVSIFSTTPWLNMSRIKTSLRSNTIEQKKPHYTFSKPFIILVFALMAIKF